MPALRMIGTCDTKMNKSWVIDAKDNHWLFGIRIVRCELLKTTTSSIYICLLTCHWCLGDHPKQLKLFVHFHFCTFMLSWMERMSHRIELQMMCPHTNETKCNPYFFILLHRSFGLWVQICAAAKEIEKQIIGKNDPRIEKSLSLDLVKSRHYAHIYFNQSALHAFNQHNTFEMGSKWVAINWAIKQREMCVCGNTHYVAKLTIDKTYWIKTKEKRGKQEKNARRKTRTEKREKKNWNYDEHYHYQVYLFVQNIRNKFRDKPVLDQENSGSLFTRCCACDLLWPINNRVRKRLEFQNYESDLKFVKNQ